MGRGVRGEGIGMVAPAGMPFAHPERAVELEFGAAEEKGGRLFVGVGVFGGGF